MFIVKMIKFNLYVLWIQFMPYLVKLAGATSFYYFLSVNFVDIKAISALRTAVE